MIDCDVHCAPGSIGALGPYLDEYWRAYIASAGFALRAEQGAYPPVALRPSRGGGHSPRPAATNLHELRTLTATDATSPRYTILNCLTVNDVQHNSYFAAALARALNDWVAAEFLDVDKSLRASIVVSPLNVGDALAELDRRTDDPRFVQVLLPVRTSRLWGDRAFFPIYEAAAARDLAIGLHAWGPSGHAPTPSGLTTTYLEDYLSNQLIVQRHVISLISEGVFTQFPGLRVALLECGFTWWPHLAWRMDKNWRGLWHEVPWVSELPSKYMRDHFRASTTPAHLPCDAARARSALELVGSDWLMYSSDYPHVHDGGLSEIISHLTPEERAAVLHGNASEFYRLP